MKFFTVLTLVDITNTGIVHQRSGLEKQRDQQRNWETVLQCIGLRAQPQLIDGPYTIDCTLSDIDIFGETVFGEMYSGEQKIWFFSFAVETEDVFLLENNQLGWLEKNFAEVPIILGLDETARFILPVFYPYGAIKNIYFINGKLRP